MIYLFSENKIVINPYHKYFQAPKTSADFSTEVLIRRSPPASQGYKDSNLEMTESESVALPFGDSPMCLSKSFLACDMLYYISMHI